jgi:hypothetical protein
MPNSLSPTLWSWSSPVFENTPIFYQHLIGLTPPFLQQCEELRDEIQRNTLVACSDGSYDPANSLSSHAWIFSSNIPHNITYGAGPVDGHPSLQSSYRAELSGILVVLYIIHKVCLHYDISTGAVQCYCFNKGAVKNFYGRPHPGILPFLTSDYDLLYMIHHMLQIILITIIGSWVKGHCTGPNPKLQHDLNSEADRLATRYQRNQPRHFSTCQMPLAPPSYRVCLLHDNSIITSKYYNTLARTLHDSTLKNCILCKTKWSEQVFLKVDWEAHSRAFNYLSRHQQIQTAKLIHNLANTNRQNHLYYGTSSACPGCLHQEETFEHVILCQVNTTRVFWDLRLKDLETSLQQCLLPPIIRVIYQGFSNWLQPNTPRHSRPTTSGGALPPVPSGHSRSNICNISFDSTSMDVHTRHVAT